MSPGRRTLSDDLIEDLSLAATQPARLIECSRIAGENGATDALICDALGGCDRAADNIATRLNKLID